MKEIIGVYSNLDAEYDVEIVEEFFSHYSFMIETLEPLIIKLEDKEHYKNSINEIFRIFHNIKSSSGYLKIIPINKLVTLGEEVLEECRMLEGSASVELIDWLIRLSDQLKIYQSDLELNCDNFSPLNHNIIKIPISYIKNK